MVVRGVVVVVEISGTGGLLPAAVPSHSLLRAVGNMLGDRFVGELDVFRSVPSAWSHT